MAEKAKEAFNDHEQVHFVSTMLSRKEYVEWMRIVDLVLLPYSAKDYAYRTSGIFVEAIVLGAVPIVTNNTWMAYELQRFDLFELIFEWDECNLMDRLCHLPCNINTRKKLEFMRSYYRGFHCVQGFATSLLNLGRGYN